MKEVNRAVWFGIRRSHIRECRICFWRLKMDAIDVKTQRRLLRRWTARRAGDLAVQFQTDAQSVRRNVMENKVASMPVVESGFPDSPKILLP